MAAIDGVNPSACTRNLLKQYENGEVSASQLKKAIVDKYPSYPVKKTWYDPSFVHYHGGIFSNKSKSFLYLKKF